MTRPVQWSRRSTADLRAIRAFIALDSEARAKTWIEELIRAGESLAQQANRGRRVREWPDPDVRELIVKHYRLVYRVAADGVVVLTVFEGLRLLPVDALEGEPR